MSEVSSYIALTVEAIKRMCNSHRSFSASIRDNSQKFKAKPPVYAIGMSVALIKRVSETRHLDRHTAFPIFLSIHGNRSDRSERYPETMKTDRIYRISQDLAYRVES